MKYFQAVIPMLLVFAGSAQGGDPDIDKTDKFVPNIQPILEVSKTTGKIVIDGDLNDTGWIGGSESYKFYTNRACRYGQASVEHNGFDHL